MAPGRPWPGAARSARLLRCGTGWRRSAAPRTRWTPTSWPAPSKPDGHHRASGPEAADLVVVNTCAFIEAARAGVDRHGAGPVRRAPARRPAGRHRAAWPSATASELAEALPEVDLVAGFGVPVTLAEPSGPGRRPRPSTFSTCPGRRPGRRGPTSRWPRDATASAGSAPSRRSGAGSGPGPRRPSWPRWTALGRGGGRARRPGPGVLRP